MHLGIVSAKGGVGKTTTAVSLALCAAQEGSTVLVDADPQGSALRWVEGAKDVAVGGLQWPSTLEVIPWELRRTVGDPGHVIYDSPPGDPQRAREVLMGCDTALLPVGARRLDVAELGPTVKVVQEVAAIRPLAWAVLITMRRLSTRAASEAPAVIENDGLPLLASTVPLLESIAAMAGSVPARVPGVYRDVWEEIVRG